MSFHHSKSKLRELEKPPHLFLNADGIKKEKIHVYRSRIPVSRSSERHEDWQAVAGDHPYIYAVEAEGVGQVESHDARKTSKSTINEVKTTS